jgi:SAM-dependent methyltransferase
VKRRRCFIVLAWQHSDIDDKLLRVQTYGESYRAEYGFEATMVRVRQDSVLRLLPTGDDLVIAEVGCGTDLLVERASQTHEFARWVIVEPNPEFAEAARDRIMHDTRVHVIEAFFEDAAAETRVACGGPADVVICSSVLHEVREPQSLLGVAGQVLAANGQLIVNVPNAQSLHRRLAVAMGLIADPAALTKRNALLGQPRVLDSTTLADLLTIAGFSLEASGGYFVKPFTHDQMADIPFLDDSIIAGLDRLGGELPDLASEIYAVARLDHGD